MEIKPRFKSFQVGEIVEGFLFFDVNLPDIIHPIKVLFCTVDAPRSLSKFATYILVPRVDLNAFLNLKHINSFIFCIKRN